MDSHLTTAMRKAGFEAAKKAVDVKSQSRAVGASKGFEDIDQGGAERTANSSTTTGLKSRVGLETAKGGESRIIASAEQSSSEEEDDKADKRKVKEKAVSELRTLPIRQKPQKPQEADEEDDERGEEGQDEKGPGTRSQPLPTSKPASKAKDSKVDEDEEDEETDEENEGDEEEEEDGGGHQQLPISKPPVKVIKADVNDNEDDDDDDDEDDDEDDDDDDDGENDDEEEDEDENEKTTSVIPVASTPTPNNSGKNDPPKFKTGGPLLDHRKLNPANKK